MNSYTKHLTLACTLLYLLVIANLYNTIDVIGNIEHQSFIYILRTFTNFFAYFLLLLLLLLDLKGIGVSLCYLMIFHYQLRLSFYVFSNSGISTDLFMPFFGLLGSGGAAVLSYLASKKNNEELSRKIFILPPAFIFSSHLCYYISRIMSYTFAQNRTIFFGIFPILVILEILVTFFLFSSLSKEKYEGNNKEILVFPVEKHIFSLIFSFGTWGIIWMRIVTDSLNRIERSTQRKVFPTTFLFLFVPFYYIFWYYKTAQILDIYSKEQGIDSNLANIIIITSIFIPVLSPIMIQDKINTLFCKS